MAERLVTFEQDGAIGTITLRRPEKFNALDIPMLRRWTRRSTRPKPPTDVRVVLLSRRGQGLLRRRRHRRLVGDERRRLPGEMGALRPSRLRPAGAAAAADDRRAVRPRAGRRAGTGRRRRFPRRRDACEARPAGDFDRRGAGLVRHAARGAPLRRAGRAAHGARRRGAVRRPRRWRWASSIGSSRRARAWPRRRPGPRTIAARGPLATEAAKLMIADRRGRGKCRRRRGAGQRLHRD